MRKKVYQVIRMLVLTLIFTSLIATNVYASNVNERSVSSNEYIQVLQANVIGCDRISEVTPYATFFNEASVSVVYKSTGMYIDICTSMNGVASVVGVKDIEIQKETWYGGWTTVATSSGGESYNVSTSVCSIVYTGAVEGESYRVVRTHYGNVDEYRELSGETSGFPCNIGYGG